MKIQLLLVIKCMVVYLLTLILHNVLVPFIRIYSISFVNKFNFLIIQVGERMDFSWFAFQTFKMHEIFGMTNKKTCINEINLGSYLCTPIYLS